MTQNEQIVSYMREHGSISTMEAFGIGITRLSARIFELKEKGYEIRDEKVKYTAQDGKKKCYNRFSIVEDK